MTLFSSPLTNLDSTGPKDNSFDDKNVNPNWVEIECVEFNENESGEELRKHIDFSLDTTIVSSLDEENGCASIDALLL